jgi:hypothetical protein
MFPRRFYSLSFARGKYFSTRTTRCCFKFHPCSFRMDILSTIKIFHPFFIREVNESCRRARNRMSPESCLSFDASWSCCRQAFHCIVLFGDAILKKCVDFTCMSKVQRTSGCYSESCQSMESAGLKYLAQK